MDDLNRAYSQWIYRNMGSGSRSFLKRLDELAPPVEILELAAKDELTGLMEARFQKSARKLTAIVFEASAIGNLSSAHASVYPGTKPSLNDLILQEYENLTKRGIRYLMFREECFPSSLSQVADSPYAIYYAGSLPDENRRKIAIIGTRNCSEYGKHMAAWFGEKLAKEGIQIISGMARGIDGISQQAALNAGGFSAGIMGSGVDVCYPPENRKLYEKLLTEGGVISEYAPGTEPRADRFPQRNRLISALSDAVLVIEAKEKSGTLITVDMALEQGREVYAIPGRATDILSAGCNRLIRQGAGLINTPEELLEEWNHQSTASGDDAVFVQQQLFLTDLRQQQAYELLDYHPLSVDEIMQNYNRVQEEKLSLQEMMYVLMQLCMSGVAKQISGSCFVRT